MIPGGILERFARDDVEEKMFDNMNRSEPSPHLFPNALDRDLYRIDY